MTEYKALLLDYGGVLTTSVVESFGAFCVGEGIDVGIFRQVVLDTARTPGSIFHRVEIGEIQQDQFDVELAKILSEASGKPIESRGLKQRLFAGSRPDEAMLAAVRTVRRHGIKTALVSNSWGGHDYPTDVLDGLFDALIISGRVGVRKPDPEIYELAARQLDLRPEQCVFVDDFRINIKGAEAVGMTGVHHDKTQETLAAIERLFAIPLGTESEKLPR